jgi:3'(2'), 5'-bisphosphate nucleotidase
VSDHKDAARYARASGELLMEIRRGAPEDAETGASGSLGRSADQRSNERLLELITRDHPGDAILSEESADDARRLDADRVWIIDPLDGTREFTERRTDWAVHVALWERGPGVTAAAVALPAQDLVLDTGTPPVVPPGAATRPRLLVSRTRPPEIATKLAAVLDGELVAMGSAGAKTMAVVLGQGDAYVHAGGQYEWDSAAPVAVAAAGGLHTSRINGDPLVYNQANPWLPDLLVCRPELAQPILDALNS